MKTKLKKKLMTAIAVAGGLFAGSVPGLAQTTAASNSDAAVSSRGDAERPTTPTDTGNKSSPAAPAPDSEPRVPKDGEVTILPYPYPGPTEPTNGGIVPPSLPTDRPADRPVPPRRPIEPGSDDAKRGAVVLVGRPARPISNDTMTMLPVPVDAKASGSGVVVYSGDIVRVIPGESRPIGSLISSPVLEVVQQFDAERTEALAARATALEQLRTATPQERETIIADLQAATRTQAVERREAARELRNEMRALREARKGGN